MKLIRSCIIAIAMYSKLPVPQFAWEEDSMKYALAFFPVVGVLLAGMELLCFRVFQILHVPQGFLAAVLTVLPVLVTGGIHADGYADTVDALASYESRERRLEILKDSSAGAFAVIWTAVYFLLCYGAWQMADSWREAAMIAAGYVLSRTFSGLAAVFFPAAKKTGTLAAFTRTADRRAVRISLLCVLLLVSAGELFLCIPVGIAVLAVIFLFFCYYYRMSEKKFGGITGDLEGWFLQICELLILLTVVLGCEVCGSWIL